MPSSPRPHQAPHSRRDSLHVAGQALEGGDYLAPPVLGFLELVSYPVLIAASEWSIIGAWIGFKTIAQYRRWGESRSTFNRFLVGNALVVVLAFLFLRHYVQVSCPN